MIHKIHARESHALWIDAIIRLSSRGADLVEYRLYFMDRFSGHIEHRREFLADDEAEAIAIADGWNNGQPMELWEGGHKLKRWEAEPVVRDA